MARSYKQLLSLIRPYTGDAFTARNGYDARKPLNFGRRMAVLKYARKVEDLLRSPVATYIPKRGEKSEVFRETGQYGYRKFNKAIIPTPATPAKVTYSVDRERPRGSQLVATDKRTGQRYYHIPAQVFLDSDEIDADFYADLIQEYAKDAEFFLIRAGESYMWGSSLGEGGQLEPVAEKIAEIFRNYSSVMFDANDKNSSYYGNWFNGITAFTSTHDAIPAIRTGLTNAEIRRQKYGLKKEHSRQTRDGVWRTYKDGSYLQGWIHVKGNMWIRYVDGVQVEVQYR